MLKILVVPSPYKAKWISGIVIDIVYIYIVAKWAD